MVQPLIPHSSRGALPRAKQDIELAEVCQQVRERRLLLLSKADIRALVSGEGLRCMGMRRQTVVDIFINAVMCFPRPFFGINVDHDQ
jgi:hypothetical protein